jgi:hypothetical protein
MWSSDGSLVLMQTWAGAASVISWRKLSEEQGEVDKFRKWDLNKLATFYGMEKNPTTIRLAKMNLAVHGLEGLINKAITYYEDPHELVGKADFVMANPPFNVDEIDAEKITLSPQRPSSSSVTTSSMGAIAPVTRLPGMTYSEPAQASVTASKAPIVL